MLHPFCNLTTRVLKPWSTCYYCSGALLIRIILSQNVADFTQEERTIMPQSQTNAVVSKSPNRAVIWSFARGRKKIDTVFLKYCLTILLIWQDSDHSSWKWQFSARRIEIHIDSSVICASSQLVLRSGVYFCTTGTNSSIVGPHPLTHS